MTEPESKREKMGFLYKDWQKNHCSEAASQQLCTRRTSQCKNSAVASFKPANLFPKGGGTLENGIQLKEASNQNSGHAVAMTLSSSNAPKLKKHTTYSIYSLGSNLHAKRKQTTDLFLDVTIRRLNSGELEICLPQTQTHGLHPPVRKQPPHHAQKKFSRPVQKGQDTLQHLNTKKRRETATQHPSP